MLFDFSEFPEAPVELRIEVEHGRNGAVTIRNRDPDRAVLAQGTTPLSRLLGILDLLLNIYGLWSTTFWLLIVSAALWFMLGRFFLFLPVPGGGRWRPRRLGPIRLFDLAIGIFLLSAIALWFFRRLVGGVKAFGKRALAADGWEIRLEPERCLATQRREGKTTAARCIPRDIVAVRLGPDQRQLIARLDDRELLLTGVLDAPQAVWLQRQLSLALHLRA